MFSLFTQNYFEFIFWKELYIYKSPKSFPRTTLIESWTISLSRVTLGRPVNSSTAVWPFPLFPGRLLQHGLPRWLLYISRSSSKHSPLQKLKQSPVPLLAAQNFKFRKSKPRLEILFWNSMASLFHPRVFWYPEKHLCYTNCKTKSISSPSQSHCAASKWRVSF